MSIALSEFWTRLVRLGLADSQRCRSLAALYNQANAGSPPSDSVAMAKFLISSGEITSFQAKGILSDRFRKLRLGNYVQRSSDTPPPFSHWLDVQSVASVDANPAITGFLLRLKNDPTATGITEALRRQSAADGPGIQPVEISLSGERPALVFSLLAPGRCLHQLAEQSNSLSPSEVVTIGKSLCDALSTFHDRGLVHRQVQADRVWMADDGRVTLLRSLTSGSMAVAAGDVAAMTHAVASMVWLDGEDFSEYYLAPEAAQQSTPASDVYSLGCLLFRLVTGRRPFTGADGAAIRSSHQRDVPQELADCVAKGEAGDPLMRIIAFAIAKNPQARFQDATQMGRAIDAIAKTYADVKSTVKTSVPEAKAVAETTVVAAAEVEPKRPAKRSIGQPEASAPVHVSVPVKAEANTEKAPEPKKPPAKPPAKPPEKATKKTPPTKQSSPTLTSPVKSADAGVPTAAPKATAPASVADSSSPSKAPVPTPTSEAAPAASSRPASTRRRRKKKSKAPLVLGGLCIAVLLLVIGLLVPGSGDGDDPSAAARRRPELKLQPQNTETASTSPGTSSASRGADTSATSASGFELVDSPKLLWAPPYSKDAAQPPLSLLPPGPGAIFSVRLNQLQSSVAGKTVVQALSPELSSLIDQVTQRTKLPADQISRCTIAMHPGRDGWPQVSLAIELTRPESLAALTQRWGVSSAITPEGEKIYAGDEVGADAFYVAAPSGNDPASDPDSITSFAVGPLDQIQQVASLQGARIPLTPALAGLWKSASETNELTALFNPNFLLTDARELFASAAPELRDPLRRLWIPTVGAVMITAAIDDDRVYLETRMAPSGEVTQPALLNSVRESFEQLPVWGENFVVATVPDPSWRLLANRLPTMLRFTVEQTRFGIDDGSVMLNAYLPAGGFAQLTLASLLAMNTPPGTTAMVAQAGTVEKLTVDQMLDREMAISFDQESLEFAIAAVVVEFKRALPPGSEPPTVRIIGGDLQKMGITQNQQIRDFKKKGVPLRTVLTDLTFAANPDKTAVSSHDPKQALIWVVADDPEESGQRAILVTTREAAAGKYEIPPEFAP